MNSPRSLGQALIEPRTQEVGRPGFQLAGVAGDGSSVFVALTAAPGSSKGSAAATAAGSAPTTTIEALPIASLGEPPRWQIELIGRGGPLVASADQVVAALAGSGRIGAAAGNAPIGSASHATTGSASTVATAAAASNASGSATSPVVSPNPTNAPTSGGSPTGSATSPAGSPNAARASAASSGTTSAPASTRAPGSPNTRPVASTSPSTANPDGTGVVLRGEPGAALIALDAKTGTPRWTLAIDATEWSVISSLASFGPTHAEILVGGSFSGTLRIGNSVVSSAGKSDGFVARITAAGSVAWLLRIGGPGADAVQGVAAAEAADRIAVAGTFAAGAEILGRPLKPIDERSPAADGFVAELDATGGFRWEDSFGGKADDTVAGVAIDSRGRIAVAATARGTVRIGGQDLTARGPADGLIAWWLPDGAHGPAVLIGGSDFDGLRAITATGDRIIVAGFYSGSLRLGSQTLAAAGGDDAFLAAFDGGQLTDTWPVSGDGREEVTSLSAIPGGFLAGVTHTATASIDRDQLPTPADPLTGAAIAIRPVR